MKLFRACDYRLQKQGCSANLGHCRPGESAPIFPAYAAERSGHFERGTAPRARLPATQIRSRRSSLTSAPSAYQTVGGRQSTLSSNWQSSLPERPCFRRTFPTTRDVSHRRRGQKWGRRAKRPAFGSLQGLRSAEVRPELRPSFRSILVGVGSFPTFSNPSWAPECPEPFPPPMVLA